MRSASEFTNIFLHRDPVDMRRGIFGLAAIVEGSGKGRIDGESLFVFSGKKRDLIKVLYFDDTGFALWQKKLERDRFPWPKSQGESVVHMKSEDFKFLLSGIDVWKLKRFEKRPVLRTI